MTAIRAQKLVVFFIVIGLLFLCLVGCSGKEDPSKHAVFFTVGDFEYVVDSLDADTVGLVSYASAKSAISVEVPASVTFRDKTYSVVRIGACAFLSADVTFVVVTKGIRSVEEYAFAHCAAQEIDLPDTVVRVGERAFADCPFLHVVRFAA
ncbi:MAG: leucine-rich repeat protein, partial [Clostridia bacterium]|nr:leucine-rich repeat protein [Clostridia bacterium]